MNTPILETERLILRQFTQNDLGALYEILSDVEVNLFLPWFPLMTMQDTAAFYEEHFRRKYNQPSAYHYAICLKTKNWPLGYINLELSDSYDLGYALRKEFWHTGIVTEAGKAVISRLKEDGIPYITATHDVNNVRSGEVMKRLGMKYCYSYKEQWMPKNIPVIFRLYQLNLDGNENRIYQKYWSSSSVHFIEPEMITDLYRER